MVVVVVVVVPSVVGNKEFGQWGGEELVFLVPQERYCHWQRRSLGGRVAELCPWLAPSVCVSLVDQVKGVRLLVPMWGA